MASYRDTRPPTTNSSSDSSSNSDSDSDEDQPWKRRKTVSHPQGVPSETKALGWNRAQTRSSDKDGAKQPRRNNVWGQVVQEQNEAHVAREMDEFGMELSRCRDVESYDYRLAREENTRVRLGAPSVSKTDSSEKRSLKRGLGETEEDSWIVDRPGTNPNYGNVATDGPRKPVHERLGTKDTSNRQTVKNRLGNHSNISDDEESPMKFIDIDPTLDKAEIAQKLADSLNEAKQDLMGRVVDILGVKKSLKLWKMTAEAEKDGGIMVFNGSRRRSPGGVFLLLMKNDPHVTKEQIDDIFTEERKKDSELKHKRDRDRNRRRKKARARHKEEDTGPMKEREETVMAEGDDGEVVENVLEGERSVKSEKESAGTRVMETSSEVKESRIGHVLEEGQSIGAEEIQGNRSLVHVASKVDGKQGGKVSSMEDGEIEDDSRKDENCLRREKNSDMEEGELEDDD